MADHATAVLAVLVLWALATLPRHGRELPALWRTHHRLVLAFGAFFAWAALSLLASGSGPRDLGLTLRLPLLLLAVPLLSALDIGRRHAWWGIWLGALTAFWLAAWDRFVNGAERAGENFHFIIHFGDLAVLFALLAAMGWPYWRTLRGGPVLMALAVAGALLAALWSGTRGAWLAIPFAGLYVLFSPAFAVRARTRAAVLAGALGVGAILFATPATGVRERVVEVVADVRGYARDADLYASSAGQRLELWRLGWAHFSAHPVFGVGAYRLQPANAALAARGERVAQHVLVHGHAHNQYVEALATGGVFGLAALLALFVLPWRHFTRLPRPDDDALALAGAGKLTLLSFAIFAASQSVFNHQGPLGIFAFLVIYFAVLARDRAPAGGQPC
jgi:O-antigen ligase